MTLSRVVIRNPVETPAQLLKQYVDWLKSHPSGAGANDAGVDRFHGWPYTSR